MEKTIQEFIENYNEQIDWNIELRQRLNSEPFSDYETIAEILENYLSDRKITPENYELSGAVMYKNNPDHYELHVYSYLTYHEAYFWTTFGMSKEEYIADRINVIKGKLSREIASTDSNIDALTVKKEKLAQFNSRINNLQETENTHDRTVEEVNIPNNFEEAFISLDALLSDEDKHYLKTDPKAAIMVHHTLGRWIRNNWGLWQEECNALKTLLTNTGIDHPDDMSNEIIEKYIEYLKGKEK